MIRIQLNEANFEYDIYSLIKAFYPKEQIVVSYQPIQEENFLFCWIVEYQPDLITITNPINTQEKGQIPVDQSDRKETKNRLKRLLYQLLQQRSKRELPWGTLTGIRPTKIFLEQVMLGKSDEDITAFAKETYYMSEEKIQECIEIARKEAQLLSKIDYENGYSLYVGIPFCPSKCLYCSFTSYPLAIWKDRVDEYLSALEKEIDFVAEKWKEKKLQSIYIGGGTPTTLEPHQLDRLLSVIKEKLDLSHLIEWTVEAGRPDSITKEKLEVLRAHGISRISINPQTMNQETLDLIGRNHSVEQIKESFALAREVGFDNINMDLIMGLPGEQLEHVVTTLEEIKALEPDSLTVHSLAWKRGARLTIEKEQYQHLTMENTQAHIDLASKCSGEMGMEPYYLYRQKNMEGNLENIGFATPGKEGIYNILIMEEKQTIVALGAGAACKYVSDGGKTVTRSENVKDVDLYIKRIDEMIERKK